MILLYVPNMRRWKNLSIITVMTGFPWYFCFLTILNSSLDGVEFFLLGAEFCSAARLEHRQLVPALPSFHVSKTDKQQSKNLFITTAVILIFRLAC